MDINSTIERLKNLTNTWRESAKRLVVSDRDRRAVIYGGAGLGVLLLYLMFQFFSSAGGRLEKKAVTLRGDLDRVESLRDEYLESARRIEQLRERVRMENQDLISVVEKALGDARIGRENFSISSRADTSSDLYDEKSVDVELRKVTLNDVVDFLYVIQSMPSFLKTSKFRIRTRFDNEDLIDVSLRVSTIRFKQEI